MPQFTAAEHWREREKSGEVHERDRRETRVLKEKGKKRRYTACEGEKKRSWSLRPASSPPSPVSPSLPTLNFVPLPLPLLFLLPLFSLSPPSHYNPFSFSLYCSFYLYSCLFLNHTLLVACLVSWSCWLLLVLPKRNKHERKPLVKKKNIFLFLGRAFFPPAPRLWWFLPSRFLLSSVWFGAPFVCVVW